MLSILLKDGERFQVSHGGVQAWVTLRKEEGRIRVLVDGPRSLKVLREKTVVSIAAGSAEPPTPETLPASAGAVSA